VVRAGQASAGSAHSRCHQAGNASFRGQSGLLAGKDPVEIAAADVFEFLAHQRGDRRGAAGGPGVRVSARTIARWLSSVSGLYAYLVARGDTLGAGSTPVPRGLSTRRQGGSRTSRMAPLVRVPWTLPRFLSLGEADRLIAALRTAREPGDGAAMLLAGLRRCEVLGMRVATTTSSRSRTGSCARWAITCTASARRPDSRTGCS